MLRLLLLVLPLGLDTFAAAAALGVAGLPAAERRRVGALLAGFEVGMPLVGLALGAGLGRAVGDRLEPVALVLVALVGLRLLLDRDDDEARAVRTAARVRGTAALALGLSISLDELAVGVTLGALDVPILPAVALLGLQAFAFASLGLRLGARLGARAGPWAERLAGASLLVVGGVLLGARLA